MHCLDRAARLRRRWTSRSFLPVATGREHPLGQSSAASLAGRAGSIKQGKAWTQRASRWRESVGMSFLNRRKGGPDERRYVALRAPRHVWPMDETAHDDMLELSLVNDLQEIGAAAERIEAFCERQEITLADCLCGQSLDRRDPDQHHQLRLRRRRAAPDRPLHVSLEGDVLVVEIVDDGRAFDSSLERQTGIPSRLWRSAPSAVSASSWSSR